MPMEKLMRNWCGLWNHHHVRLNKLETQGFDRPVDFREELNDKTKNEIGYGEG